MSRARRWVLAVLVAVALPVVAILWLLNSGAGREWTLARVLTQLPDGTLSVGKSEGSLAGPLVLHDIEYRTDGLGVHIATLKIDHAVSSLISGRLNIGTLHIDRLQVALDPSLQEDTPTQIVLPDSVPWPVVALPIDISVAELRVDQLDVIQGAEVVLPPTKVMLRNVEFVDGRLSLPSAMALNQQGTLTLHGETGFSGKPNAEIEAALTFAGERAAAATLAVTTAGGDLKAALALVDAGDVTLQLGESMDWQLIANLAIRGPSRWLPKPPFDAAQLELRASGDSMSAVLAATVDVDGQRVQLDDARLALIDGGGALAIEHGRLIASLTESADSVASELSGASQPRIGSGTVDISGRVDFAEAVNLQLEAQIDALQLPLGTAGDQALLSGTLTVSGARDTLGLAFVDGRLQRGPMNADVAMAGQLLPATFRIDRLDIKSEQGGVSASGQLGWEPVLSADIRASLQNFDPSMLLAELPGKISGELSVIAVNDPSSPQLTVHIDSLSGTLRDRPLSGGGDLVLSGVRSDADIKIALGDSRLHIKGDPGEQLDLAIKLSPLNLADLSPSAHGELVADIRMLGSRSAPRIVGNVAGLEVVTEFVSASRIGITMDAALDAETNGQVTVNAETLELGGTAIESLSAELRGNKASHTVKLTADSARGDLALAATGALRGEIWSGEIATFDVKMSESEALRIKSPARLQWESGKLNLEEMCLSGSRSAEICVAAKSDTGGQTLTGHLRALDLDGVITAFGAQGLRAEGVAEGEFNFTRRNAADPQGTVALRLPTGSLAQSDMTERPLLRWDALQLTGELSAEALSVRLTGKLESTGSIEGELTGANPFKAPEAPIQGTFGLSLPDISALELVMADAANVKGSASANVQFSGTWQAPEATGSVELSALGAEVPALGIRIRESMLSLRGDGQTLELDGLLDTGAGALRIEGSVNDLMAETLSGRLRVSGDGVRVAKTPQVSAIVSPDLTLAYAKKRLRVTGKVVVPEAAVAIEELEGSVSTSPDVVVLDPLNGKSSRDKIDLRAQIDVVLGDKVTLQGFGFDGGVEGSLQVNERSGRATTGRGTLKVRGTYKAYGQDLEIVRGRLLFASSPLDDPGIEVRAQRKIKQVTVGIEVVGSARMPELSVWSDPALDQAEALSYLVLGRPLRSASAAEGAQLGQAAAAFGGNYLAKRVGSRLGFDTFGVADSQSLGGAAFTVGKYLSPALYLSYGVSLFGSGEVVTLRYLLSERFDIEIESSDESRAGLNYHIER